MSCPGRWHIAFLGAGLGGGVLEDLRDHRNRLPSLGQAADRLRAAHRRELYEVLHLSRRGKERSSWASKRIAVIDYVM